MDTRTKIHTLLGFTLGLATLAGCDDFENLDDVEEGLGFDETDETDESEPIEPIEPIEPLALQTTPQTEQPVSAPLNLAFGRPTVQSSTVYGGDSSRAVDGNRDGNYWNNSVTHTNTDGESWWQVDLQNVQPVGEIVVWNRTDCCTTALHDFTVYTSADGVHWEAFSRSGVAGRRTNILVDRPVRWVHIANPYALTLAEVEVFRTRNLAHGKPTFQSSTAFGGEAARAVDGNTDGNYWHDSVTHTAGGSQDWWMVDLESVQVISQVVIFNRTDYGSAQLHDFMVRVSNDGENWRGYSISGPAGETVIVPVNREARFVQVENGFGYLHLAEVQVFEGLRVPGMSYGRGAGTIPSWDGCEVEGKIYQDGLCYVPCDLGYVGVGPVCWRDITNFESVTTTACEPLRNPYLSHLADESEGAITAGVGLGLAAVASVSGEIGLAYGRDGEFGCYVTSCAGVTSNVALSAFATVGYYNQFANIAGDSWVSSLGAGIGLPIPGTPIAIGFGGTSGKVTNTQGTIGYTLSGNVAVGLPMPIDLGTLSCHTSMVVVP